MGPKPPENPDRRRFMENFLPTMYAAQHFFSPAEAKQPEAAEHSAYLKKYQIPAGPVQDAGIENLVRVLARGDIHNPQDVRDLIDFLQHAEFAMTGKTYQQNILARYGQLAPIDVVLKSDSGQDESCNFVRGYSGDRNMVSVNSGLKPIEFLQALAHKLNHGIYGNSELQANAHTHMLLSNLISRFPELINEDASKCLLSQMIDNYTFGIRFASAQRHPILLYSTVTPYLALLVGTDKLEEAVSVSTSPWIEANMAGAANYWLSISPTIFKNNCIGSFLQRTSEYILAENPNIPSGRRGLMNAKIRSVHPVRRLRRRQTPMLMA